MIELSIVAPSQMWQLGPIIAGAMICHTRFNGSSLPT